MKPIVLVSLVVATLSTAGTYDARAADVAATDAAPAPAFGRRGQIIIEPGSRMELGRLSLSSAGNDQETSSYAVEAAIRVFATDRLAFGVHAGVQQISDESTSQPEMPQKIEYSRRLLQTGVSVAWNVPVSSWASWLPTFGLSYARIRSEVRGSQVSNGVEHDNGFGAHVSAPLLMHPARHVFVGVGPSLNVWHDRAYGGDMKQTTVRFSPVTLSFGAWF